MLDFTSQKGVSAGDISSTTPAGGGEKKEEKKESVLSTTAGPGTSFSDFKIDASA